jgi:hypothetical protein
VEPLVAARSTRKRLVDRLASHRSAIAWVLLSGGAVIAGLVVFFQDWLQGALTLVSVAGFLLGFSLWVGPRPRPTRTQSPHTRGQRSGSLPGLVTSLRARRWRRAVGATLTRSDLSLSAKQELVEVLCDRRDLFAVRDMLRWAANSRVPAEVRFDIAEIAARADLAEGVALLKQFASYPEMPFNVRFDAAEALLWYDEATADRALEALGRSAEAPDTLRLEAAAILSERLLRGVTGPGGVEVLGLLVADASISPWTRIEACKALRPHGAARYRPALWSLTHDSRLPAPQRLSCGQRLAQVDPDTGARAWTALVHDTKLPIWARIESASRLGAIVEAEGALALRALLESPDIDDRERFEVVRKLTLLDLPQVNAP